MTDRGQLVSPSVAPDPAGAPRLVLASRGDALTDHLLAALQRRFPVLERIDPELTPRQRYQVAAVTLRAGRTRWVERFYKSAYARRLRSANAARLIGAMAGRPDAVVQVHALFDLPGEPTVLYIDCTHRQSAESWPAWNPLRGRALELWYRREQASYTTARHLFAFSEQTRDSLVHQYGVDPHRVTVTGAGANLARLPVLHPARPGRESAPTILFIGNDFVRKGGEVLLEAFRTVRAELPGARLRLVGTPPGIRVQPGVEVLGRISDRDRIAELYTEAAVFALPSLFEPYGFVILEAMAFGLPVVTTMQPGTAEIIVDGSTGRMVERGSAAALAAALLQLLRDPALAARLGAAARRDVEERFTWDAVVERMAPALEQLSSRTPR